MVMATLSLWEEISMMKVVAALVLIVLGFVPVWFWMHFSRRKGDIFCLCSKANVISKCVGKIGLGFWCASRLFCSSCRALWKVIFSWSRISYTFFHLEHCRSPAVWFSEQWLHFGNSEVQSWLVWAGEPFFYKWFQCCYTLCLYVHTSGNYDTALVCC